MADSEPDVWRTALDTLLAHVVRHFDNEEAVLARHGYQRLASHQGAHAALVQRARQLKAVVNDHGPSLGPLVNFVARDVIAKHILNVDRDYYPLFRR